MGNGVEVSSGGGNGPPGRLAAGDSSWATGTISGRGEDRMSSYEARSAPLIHSSRDTEARNLPGISQNLPGGLKRWQGRGRQGRGWCSRGPYSFPLFSLPLLTLGHCTGSHLSQTPPFLPNFPLLIPTDPSRLNTAITNRAALEFLLFLHAPLKHDYCDCLLSQANAMWECSALGKALPQLGLLFTTPHGGVERVKRPSPEYEPFLPPVVCNST